MLLQRIVPGAVGVPPDEVFEFTDAPTDVPDEVGLALLAQYPGDFREVTAP